MSQPSLYAVLQYNGTNFCGWQRQPSDRTVQGELESGLQQLNGSRVVTNAAGRTDAGVHALAQVVSFSMGRDWEPEDLRRAVNATTPEDMWISRVGVAPRGFHARKQATSRRYRYLVGCDAAAASPFRRPFEWDLREPLDADALDAAAAVLQGEHDFRSFSTAGQEKPHYRSTIAVAEWQARAGGQGFIFQVEADRFLHRMVRFLVGMMVDVGRGRRPLADIQHLLESPTNQEASPPAPPRGLYFVSAKYPNMDLETANEDLSRYS